MSTRNYHVVFYELHKILPQCFVYSKQKTAFLGSYETKYQCRMKESRSLLPLDIRLGYVQNAENFLSTKNFHFFFIFFAKLSIPSYFIHFFVL